MKNQKSNALWGVAIVLILGIAYFMNATSWLSKPLFPEAPKKEANKGGPSEAQTMATLAQTEKSRVLEARGPNSPLPESTVPAEPAIFKKKQAAYKPQPNPTSTPSQWWDEEGYLDKQRAETEEKRGF